VLNLNRDDLQFSLVTFVAAMLALYISMSIDLQRPYWAMMTVYIVSQPMAAAVRSKAVYRLIGTLTGAAVAVLLVPLLIDAPVLLCLALALWVGLCLTISMLDRSPRSYVMMLAGYTAAIIGFGSVNQPLEIFALATARSEEIIIGIVCATVLHSLWFPKPVGLALRTRLADWLAMADQWAIDIVENNDSMALRSDRLRLAAAASEIHIMATHLPFDVSHFRETVSVVRALHDRILMLIPTLSTVGERFAAMRSEHEDQDGQSREILAAAAHWIRAGQSGVPAQALAQRMVARAAQTPATDWYGLNQIAMLTSLAELIKTLNESRSLLDHLHTPERAISKQLDQIIARSGARPLHSDTPMALLGGLTASVAILLSCFVWITMGWAEGGASAMLAAILSCLFAAMDDPTPAMKKFGYSQLIAVPIAGIYIFGVFPLIHSFPMLVLALSLTMLPIGLLLARPGTALLGFITLLNISNAMALQESVNPDFASFANLNLSMFFGIFTAIFITRSFRSASTEANAQRLLRQTWHSLARLVHGFGLEDPASFASQMVDRLSILTPLLSASQDQDLQATDTMNELRTGMDLVAIQNDCRQLALADQQSIERILLLVGAHYQARTLGKVTDDEPLLGSIDHALRHSSAALQSGHVTILSALVGLRSNLFPNQPYQRRTQGVAS